MNNIRILPLGTRYAISNLLKYMAVRIGIINYFVFIFKEGDLAVYKKFIMYKDIKFEYDGLMQFKNSIQLLHDIYLIRPYAKLQVRDKVVIDVGAAIGDTAIYFRMLGAKKVIAFEPFPYSYKIAKRNIAHNSKKYKEWCILVNKAVGRPGTIIINENYKSHASSFLFNSKNGMPVEILSLDEVVKKYNVPPHSALKVDCEGSELDVIKHASLKTLQLFDQVILEYEDDYNAIANALKVANFKIKKTADMHEPKNGILYAWR